MIEIKKCGICSIELKKDNHTTSMFNYMFDDLSTSYIKLLPNEEYGGYLCVACEEELTNESDKIGKDALTKMIKFANKIKGRKSLPLKYYEMRKISRDLNITGNMKNKVVEIDNKYYLAINEETAKETFPEKKISIGNIISMTASNKVKDFFYNIVVVK